MIVVSFFAPRFDRWKNVDYDELLMLLDKSCKRLYFKHIVISDRPRPKPLDTFVCDLPENLMQAFLYGQIEFLKKTKEEVLFTGADCLLVKDPRNCFLNDLTITVSDTFSDCKMNTGAIFVKNINLCSELWQEALNLKPIEWGEDQTVLYKTVLKWEKEEKINVTSIPCEEHNWAPRNLNDNAGFPTVIHFRGGVRKKFMAAWADKYLNIL